MSETLKRILREEIAAHDAHPFTTPHLSRVRHAQAALLALLEEPNSPAARAAFPVLIDEMDKPGPHQYLPEGASPHLKDTLTLVVRKDGRGP